jgi:uncharacterized membrane-anchored protein YitT (DUF2179 family)
MKTTVKQFLTDTAMMLAGSLLIAMAIAFLRPHQFLSGGMAGTTLIVSYYWNVLPFGVLYMLLNIPVFVVGYFILGRKFLVFSLWASLIHTVVFSFLVPTIEIQDKLLSVLIASVFGGAGVAIILRTNGTVSGIEVISIIINRFYSVNLSTMNLTLNTLLVLCYVAILTIAEQPLYSALYSFVYVFTSAQIMNGVFKGLAKRKSVMIMSKRWSDILDEINKDRRIGGVTLLSAKGGYRGEEAPILFSIVRSHQVSLIRAVTTRIDPDAFIVIMETTDIVHDTIGNQPPWKKQLYRQKK